MNVVCSKMNTLNAIEVIKVLTVNPFRRWYLNWYLRCLLFPILFHINLLKYVSELSHRGLAEFEEE